MQKQLDRILAPYQEELGGELPALREVQKVLGYLPPEAISEIAKLFRRSESEIYGVATLHGHFKFGRQPAKHIIKVCGCPACYVSGSELLLKCFEGKFSIKVGEITKDNKFGLERVAYTGGCTNPPVIVVDEIVYRNVTPGNVKEILDRYW